VKALKAALTTEANTVQVQTGGDAEKILTTGFKVKTSRLGSREYPAALNPHIQPTVSENPDR
jgi:hypothetical protein